MAVKRLGTGLRPAPSLATSAETPVADRHIRYSLFRFLLAALRRRLDRGASVSETCILLAVFKPFGQEALVAEDGAYTPFQVDGDGSLRVKVVGTVQSASASGDQSRPLVFHYGSSAEFLFPVFDDTEYHVAGTPNGAMHVCLRGDDGVALGTTTNPVRVSGEIGQSWDYQLAPATQQSDTLVEAAPGAGSSIYITDIYVAAGSAVTITLEDGDNTFLWAYPAQAAGEGASVSLRTPIKLAENKALTWSTSAAVQVYFHASGYVGGA